MSSYPPYDEDFGDALGATEDISLMAPSVGALRPIMATDSDLYGYTSGGDTWDSLKGAVVWGAKAQDWTYGLDPADSTGYFYICNAGSLCRSQGGNFSDHSVDIPDFSGAYALAIFKDRLFIGNINQNK